MKIARLNNPTSIYRLENPRDSRVAAGRNITWQLGQMPGIGLRDVLHKKQYFMGFPTVMWLVNSDCSSNWLPILRNIDTHSLPNHRIANDKLLFREWSQTSYASTSRRCTSAPRSPTTKRCTNSAVVISSHVCVYLPRQTHTQII